MADKAEPPRIKKLSGFKDLWRLRVSDDYRLVYRVDRKTHLVTMLMLGDRKAIYDRLGMAENGQPGVRIVARAEDLLEREPTPEEVGRAELSLSHDAEVSSESSDSPLPKVLDADCLRSWSIPSEFHSIFQSVRTENELIELGVTVPEEVLQRVLNGLWPPLIEELVQQPVRIALDDSRLEGAAVGEFSLDSFLLHLDDDQKAFVERFAEPAPKGPWLLKGGPGSGKSTVALYCINSLVRGATNSGEPSRRLRILFTTFTNSLANASAHLLEVLQASGSNHTVDVKTVDSLAFAHLPDSWRKMRIERNPRAYVLAALNTCVAADATFAFTEADTEFLLEEIDWVLIGQGLTSADDYLVADRGGRRRPLGQQQRRQVWQLFEVVRGLLRSAEVCLFSERLQEAAIRVTSQYDYVFVDEAQDLKPVAIRFCLGLCSDPTNIFLTADTNQSIYGNGLSWSKVAAELRFQGRARTLRKNYRTTVEIWEAILQLSPNSDDTDRETMEIESLFKGPYPVLSLYKSDEELAARLNAYFQEAFREERVGPGCGAVLCSNMDEAERATSLIDPRYNPRAMQSRDLDLSHPGIKVITMHAAKGLQFPVVALVGLEAGKFPSPAPAGVDPSEHEGRQRRLLFVACSRAMRRLIVFASRDRPSSFVSAASDTHWDIEEQ